MYDGLYELDIIEDSIRKIKTLLAGLCDEYRFSCEERPEFEMLKKINFPSFDFEEQVVRNTRKWICHYKHIMLHLDMIDDYVAICSRNISAAIAKSEEEPEPEPEGELTGVTKIIMDQLALEKMMSGERP